MNDKSGSGGRPSKYRDEFAEVARKACELGARDIDLAEMLDVSLRTINQWKVTYPAFNEALKAGKGCADSLVTRSLFERATGYSHDAVKFHVVEGQVVETPYVEHYPPDTTAMIFWLKNRRPELWRDKHEIAATVAVQEPLDFRHLSQDERNQLRALLMKGNTPMLGVGVDD